MTFPSESVTVTVHGSGDESRAVNWTGAPGRPLTTGS
jgi:hypothetical protein